MCPSTGMCSKYKSHHSCLRDRLPSCLHVRRNTLQLHQPKVRIICSRNSFPEPHFLAEKDYCCKTLPGTCWTTHIGVGVVGDDLPSSGVGVSTLWQCHGIDSPGLSDMPGTTSHPQAGPPASLHNLPVPSCPQEQKQHCSGSQWIFNKRGEEGEENPVPSPLPCFSQSPSAGLPSWSATWGWAPPPCAPPAPRWPISAGSEGGCSCPARCWRSCSVWHGLQWPSSAHWAHFSASCSLTPALASGKHRAIKQFK